MTTRELLAELGCDGVISTKGFPLQAGRRWVVERTNSWHIRGFRKLAICTERGSRVVTAYIALQQFGTRVRQLRRERGLSQEGLADAAGLHRTYIGSVERGERNISLVNILRLAMALHTDAGELVTGLELTEIASLH